MEYKYQIGSKTYVQKALVLGQWRQLLHLMKGLSIPQNIDTAGVVSAFGDKLSYALAIVLTEEGKRVQDKDINALASQLEFEIAPEVVFEVAEHFFDCNPLVSLLKRLEGITGRIGGKMAGIGSKISASYSPGETSPNEMPLPGDTPSMNADPISVLASVT